MSGEQTIALCLMVKNEAAVLPRLISSVAESVDLVIASDTGSTDNTVTVLTRLCQQYHLPLVVHHHDWVNFGHNRTELMKVSRGKATWLLLLDADHTLDGPIDRAGLSTGYTSYDLRFSGPNDHTTRRLVRGDIEWVWKGSVHEYLTSRITESPNELRAPTITHHGDGGSWQGDLTEKWERYTQLLLEDYRRGKVPTGRTAFYLGQTYADMGQLDFAAWWYGVSYRESHWDEERWLAGLRAAVLEDSITQLLESIDERPTRAETYYHLSVALRRRNQHTAALLFAERGLEIPYPKSDILFIDRWVYDWGLQLERSISLWWTGQKQEAHIVTLGLLEAADHLNMPEYVVNQLVENMKFMPGSA